MVSRILHLERLLVIAVALRHRGHGVPCPYKGVVAYGHRGHGVPCPYMR
ncbi:MAG: hypothetical protein IKX31_05695 [Muribaculaceae bacterium]|nr:hypothetical protein [Muribaculaceae bacterium]